MPCVLVLARVTRAAGGSSLRVGQGTRPLSVGVECVARRPRHIRAGLLGLTGWRASLTAARRSRRARAPTHLMQATAVTCHTHRGERPRLEHAHGTSRRTLRRGVAPASHLRADARTAAGVAEVRRGTNAGQATADSAHRRATNDPAGQQRVRAIARLPTHHRSPAGPPTTNSAAASVAAVPVTPRRPMCSWIAAHAPPRRRLPSGTGT